MLNQLPRPDALRPVDEPAEIRQHPGQLLRRVALAQRLHVQIALALGQLPARGRDYKRRVAVFRRRAAEGLYQPLLPRRGGQQVPRAHNARHAHCGVVHRDGKLIGEHPVRAADDEVPALARRVFDVCAVVPVLNGDGLVRRNHFICRAAPAPLERGDLRAGQRAAAAGAGVFLPRMRGRGSEPLRARAPAGVEQPLFPQPPEGLLVFPRPPALAAVRLHRPAEVPVEAQPAQVLRHKPGGILVGALRVEVLEPEEHLPSARAHVQPGE